MARSTGRSRSDFATLLVLDEFRQLLARTRLAVMAKSLMVFDLEDQGYYFSL